MKKIISSLLLLIISTNAFADCDFSKGITVGPNDTYIYNKECHIKVGQLVQDNKIKDSQISDLNQAIQLKDLALTKSDERVQLWMNTSYKLEDRLTSINSLEKKNEVVYFILGIAVTSLAVWGAGQLAH